MCEESGEIFQEEVYGENEALEECPADGEVSLHALQGSRTRRSMRIPVMVNRRRITILIDCGSTHSYLDSATAQDLQVAIETTHPWIVTVAGDHILVSREKCEKFSWQSEGHKFTTSLRIIPIGGCDVIL